MANSLGRAFESLGHILGVCPCCTDLFYLSAARPYLAGRKPRSVIDDIRSAERRLDRAEENLAEIESALREAAAKAGLRTAKKLLKKIDPVFSGAGYDPQDVKVIFNPVPYVVFDGMARVKLTEIVLLAHPPEDGAMEIVQKSISQAIKKGNCEFKTLRVDNEGKIDSA